MNTSAWMICGIGVLFCISGLYLFFKNVYEDDRSTRWPFAVILMGIVLVAIGSAKFLRLI